MGDGIEVRFEYDGMHVFCDDAAIARLYEHICGEASIAEVLDKASRPGSVQFISVRQPLDEPAAKSPRWFELVPVILVSCFSLVVFIVGLVTIYQWAMRQL